MDYPTFYPAATVAPLLALNLVLVACLVSNRAAEAVLTVVGRPVGWVGSTARTAVAVAVRAARTP